MKLSAFLFALLFPVLLLSQEVIQPAVDLSQNVEVNQFIEFLIKSLGGVKGASSMAVVALAVQGLVMFLRTKYSEKFTKKYKLMLVYGASMVGGVLTLMSQGIDLQAALLHANSLAAYQVLFHQAIKIYTDKKNEAPTA